MVDTPPPSLGVHRLRLLVDQLWRTGQAVTTEEIRMVRDVVARRGYDPAGTKRTLGRMTGQTWSGGIIAAGDAIPTAERDFILHARINQEWPTGTSLNEFIESLRSAVLDPDGGVFLAPSSRGGYELTFIARKANLRGPSGSGWILVGYEVDDGWWMAGFQPSSGMNYVEGRTRLRSGRWLKSP